MIVTEIESLCGRLFNFVPKAHSVFLPDDAPIDDVVDIRHVSPGELAARGAWRKTCKSSSAQVSICEHLALQD